MGRLILRFEPSATWLRSRWPVDRIWQANQAGADTDAAVDLAAGGVGLEIRGSILLFRLTRGPGAMSLDHLIARAWFGDRR